MTIPHRVLAILGAAVLCLSITVAATAAGATPPSQRNQAGSAISTDQQEAVASYNTLQQNFYVARQSLYRGTSCGTYSCLWPFTNAYAGTAYLYGAPNGAHYSSDVAARQTGLGHYADLLEHSPRARHSHPPTSPPWRRRSDREVPPTTTTTRGLGST